MEHTRLMPRWFRAFLQRNRWTGGHLPHSSQLSDRPVPFAPDSLQLLDDGSLAFDEFPKLGILAREHVSFGDQGLESGCWVAIGLSEDRFEGESRVR